MSVARIDYYLGTANMSVARIDYYLFWVLTKGAVLLPLWIAWSLSWRSFCLTYWAQRT